MRGLVSSLAAFAVLAGPSAAGARTLPLDVARTKAKAVARQHYRDEGMRIRAVFADACARVSAEVARCQVAVDAHDAALGGPVYCNARVRVRFAFPTGNALSGAITRDRCDAPYVLDV